MAKTKQRAVIIGLGGIGGWLLDAVARFMAYDPDREWELVLVDGDDFTVGNKKRQAFHKPGNKALVKAEILREQFGDQLIVNAISAFVAAPGIELHANHAKQIVMVGDLIEEGDWVFLCVDNHATRKLVSDHIQALRNVRLFSGGNDLTDGNVQIVIRRNGKNLMPALDAHHPEIANPPDRAPFAMSCEELAQAGSTQLIFANMGAAWAMSAAFWAELNRKLTACELYFDLAPQTLGGPAMKPVVRKV